MNRRDFLLLTGSTTVLATASTVASQPTTPPTHPTLREDARSEFGWTKLNQYTRTSEQDNGEDQGRIDVDFGDADNWYISEFVHGERDAFVEEATNDTLEAPISYLWSLQVDPSTLTRIGWKMSGKLGELGEAGVGIDSDVLDEFEAQTTERVPDDLAFYPPSPINMRVVRATGEAIVSKIPGGSFLDEAKTWIKGPCAGLVTASGKGVFYEKYWIRRRITENEFLEYKGVFADWIGDGEYRAVAGAVPWSREHLETTGENLGYELTLQDEEMELEEELKHVMASVEFHG